jgi:hypothetical protein
VSVVEDCQIELAEAHRVREYVDFDDLPAPDCEDLYCKPMSARSHNDTNGSISRRRGE